MTTWSLSAYRNGSLVHNEQFTGGPARATNRAFAWIIFGYRVTLTVMPKQAGA